MGLEAHALRAEIAAATDQPAALIEAAGFPSATAARQMAAATQALLWSTAARA